MIRASNPFLALCFACFLPLHAFAQVPVVDDSENFAILDEQQAANELPVAKSQIDYSDTEEEIALAQDNDIDNRDNRDNVGLLNKLRGLQQEVQELRGQLEVQAHELKLLQQQQLAFYKDLDTRVRGNPVKTTQELPGAQLTQNSETTTAPKPIAEHLVTQSSQSHDVAAPIIATSHTNNPADEQIAYLAAYDLVKNKRFDEAQVAMQNFIASYPKGGYTANAQYWLGELYMVKKNYPEAIQHFEIVLKDFASSSKAAACSLKIGYALASSGKTEEAKQRLQQVLKNYPDTPTAQLASTKLLTINAS